MRASVSVGRIDSFIRDTEQLDDQPLKFTEDADSKTAIRISNAEFRFSRYGSSGFNLKIEDLRFSKNSITIVAGDVGSGKSALLLGLLGELSLRKGQVEVAKEPGSKLKVSYAAQSPWLQGRCLMSIFHRTQLLTKRRDDRHVYQEQHSLWRRLGRRAVQRHGLCLRSRE